MRYGATILIFLDCVSSVSGMMSLSALGVITARWALCRETLWLGIGLANMRTMIVY